jgi:polysaccharide biosynthesis/export protein
MIAERNGVGDSLSLFRAPVRGLLKRWRVLLLLCSFACSGLCGSTPILAQTAATPSADALQLFQNLTPDQQDAILRQLGGSAGGLPGLGGTGAGTNARPGQTAGERNATPENEQATEQRPSPEGEEAEPAIPVLKAQDWVIIEVDFHLAPRPLTQSLQALYLSQASSLQNMQALQALSGNAVGVSPQVTALAGATPQQATSSQQGNQQSAPNPADQLTDDQKKALSAMMDLIRQHNPYRLSRDGVLYLPGFPGIALLGLTEDQATMRLQADPAFHDVQIRLSRLPLKKTGREALKPFGYDLFQHAPSTFAPVTNVPVPADYVVGPGDIFEVQLYGNVNRTLTLQVDRSGRVNFPEIGPINVNGQLFTVVQQSIEARVARQMIGVRASVSMRDTRAIRVFVLGEANHPGSYAISGLGTITSALFAAGGVKPVGSLRKIQLKRAGTLVRTLDLYDLLIRGDTTDDTKLLPGDVIFVPSVGATVSADGEVRRPAIYEIKNESTVADLVQLAGGLTPNADLSSATLTRIDEQQRRVVLRISSLGSTAKTLPLHNGDELQIYPLKPTLDSGITVEGHLFTPVVAAYRAGLRLSDVIHSVDELQPNADIHYLLIRRELPPDRKIVVLSADLAAALRNRGSTADVLLQPRDRITVFDLSTGRDRVIQPLMDELTVQSTANSPRPAVRVIGRVKVPGEYPLESNMTVADLVRAGGGLADEAYPQSAELTRYEVVNGEERRTRLIDIDLAAALRGDPTHNIRLEPFDNLSVKEVPEWGSQESVTLSGEVRFPGTYAIRRGETLTAVIARAGGLTRYAFPEGSVFTREELRRREQEQIDQLGERMRRDLAYMALQGAVANQTGGAAAALSLGQTLMSQLRGARAVGRLVIDLPRALASAPGSSADVILRNGDSLIVPRFQQEVTVIGEVQNTTSHLYRPGLGRDDYIALSGGMTNRADRGKIYVVRANGSVVAATGSRWFQFGARTQIKPGDTVVVPLDTERMPPLPFWQAVTSILYNLAIAAAAAHSF